MLVLLLKTTKMVLNTKDLFKIKEETGMESFTIKEEVFMMDSGKIII